MTQTPGIGQFEQFYLRDGLPGDAPKTILCMDDRPYTTDSIPPAIMQTAGSVLGLGYDVALTRAAMGKDMEYVPAVATRLAIGLGNAGISAYLHSGKCGGEVAMPNVAHLVSRRHPEASRGDLNALGLDGLPDSIIDRAHQIFTKQAATPLIPHSQTAASFMEIGDSAAVRESVVGPHVAGTVLIDHTGQPFDTRAAWRAGNPAYNISFGAMLGIAREAMGNESDALDESLFLTISALRHLVTAAAVLSHPEPGRNLDMLIHV